jgi:DNA processing protein
MLLVTQDSTRYADLGLRRTLNETATLALGERDFRVRPVSPFREIGAYEALWDEDDKASFRTIANKFREHPDAVPSDFVEPATALRYAARVVEAIDRAGLEGFGVRVHGAGEYPPRLRDAADPVELLYFQGCWDLVEDQSVSVVGTRKPSHAGIARARKLVRRLVEDQFTIVSGLAMGIDTVAHSTAIEAGGRTIAVIGTPLSESYPKENRDLQKLLVRDFLVISQVPFCRYRRQTPRVNRVFFPERNITMAALSRATIIVEAGETSGTLIQAKAALKQGRMVFILDSCFQNPQLTWPARLARQGAIRVADYGDIQQHLARETDQNR